MKNNQIFTRFAPSNTGAYHVGSARTTLFAYALSQKEGIGFRIRIEDSDSSRSTKQSLIDILDGISWLGIKWEVGPKIDDVKQDKLDPKYFQSMQTELYDKYAKTLSEKGLTYEQEGCLFFKMPKKEFVLNDEVLGEIKFPASEQKDFIIRRNNGGYIFHFVNVVSDIIDNCKILIKGSDHVCNFPKQAALFEAFGVQLPRYAHLPLLMDAQGQKLSKRRTDQGANIQDLKAQGYLPEAVVNTLGLCGWSNPEKKEIFDINYMCQVFDLKDCMKSQSRYDVKKLLHINQHYIQTMDKERFRYKLLEWANVYATDFLEKFNETSMDWEYFCETFQSRCKLLSDIVPLSKFLLEDITYESKAIEKYVKDSPLDEFKTELESLDTWDETSIDAVITNLMSIKNLAIGKVANPIRTAITGDNRSPELSKSLVLLGRDKTIERIQYCVNMYTGALAL